LNPGLAKYEATLIDQQFSKPVCLLYLHNTVKVKGQFTIIDEDANMRFAFTNPDSLSPGRMYSYGDA
jgi:hypothetical protein